MSLLGNQIRRLQKLLVQIEDSKIFYDPDSPSSYDNTAFLIKLSLPRVQESLTAKLECCEIHEKIRVFQETFLIVNMLDEVLMNYNDSRILATLLGILRTEGIEKSESEDPLQSTPLSCSEIRARQKV